MFRVVIDFGHYTVVWAHKKSLIPLSVKSRVARNVPYSC
jgi:hypothetical protein